MDSVAAEQRHALVEALRSVGPVAPTLCEGWSAEDLALHIVIRDRRPDLMVGAGLPLVGESARAGQQRLKNQGYPELIRQVEAGPPSFYPQRLRQVDDLMNTAEFHIHTEDILRAQAEFDPAHRRGVSTRQQRHLWRQAAPSFFTMAARKLDKRITFLSPEFGAVTRGRSGAPLMIVQGEPSELALWASGRRDQAVVEIEEP